MPFLGNIEHCPKFLEYALPIKFINDTILRFDKEKEELLIPKWLFDKTKLVVIDYHLHPQMKNLVSAVQVN